LANSDTFCDVMGRMAPSDDDIPDLLPPGRAPPRREAAKSAGPVQAGSDDGALPLLDLEGPDESNSLDVASDGGAPELNFKPPTSRPASGSAAASSVRPPDFTRDPPRSSAGSRIPVASDVPNFGGDVALEDDLDDLEFGGPSSQLNVVVDTRDPQKDIPWPNGRTPFEDEILPDLSHVKEISGFGEAPRSFYLTPLYAYRVYSSLDALRKKLAHAEHQLAHAEANRDALLAEFAESKRAELTAKHRFAPLFLKVIEHESAISQKQTDLQNSGVQGDAALGQIRTKIAAQKTEKQQKQRDRDEQHERLKHTERELARHTAALKKVDIQYRNLQTRLEKEAPGTDVPPEFEEQFQSLDSQKGSLQAEIAAAKEAHGQQAKVLRESEKHLAQASASLQLEEGKKEALVISQEGEASELNRDLELASFHRQTELADATRVLLELKGEFPVEPQVRKQVILLDESVRQAFVLVQSLRLAQHSMDSAAYSTGRSIIIGVAVALLLVLVYSAL
jgi:hypothetical protein